MMSSYLRSASPDTDKRLLALKNQHYVRARIKNRGWTVQVEILALMTVQAGHATWREAWQEASPTP